MLVCLRLVMYTPFSKHIENTHQPANATTYVMAKVDYDGNFYWIHDSQKYEYALEEYGLVEEYFEFGDKVKVYINTCITNPMYLYANAHRTFGKYWIEFYNNSIMMIKYRN